jgi:hypothetical protein
VIPGGGDDPFVGRPLLDLGLPPHLIEGDVSQELLELRAPLVRVFGRVQPVCLQTPPDRKSLNHPKEACVDECRSRSKNLGMGHYSRRPGEM